jgi:ubiquinone biosynthesis protein
VQRPGIGPQVQADMEILREIARLIEDRTQWGRQYGVTAIVEEFARSMRYEMDYCNEAANADRLRREMADQPHVHVPHVYWELVTSRVMTMEAIEGVKVNQLDLLDQAGVDRVKLADTFIHSIFKQLLINGFFHADPHPGNLLVDPHDGTLIYIDLGMMGMLLPEQRQQLGDIVQAVLRRDSREVVRMVMLIGTPFKPVKENDLRREVDHIIGRYLESSLERISFANLLSEILAVIFQQGIRLPSELSLAIKTLIQGEGVARLLDPGIEIIEIMRNISHQILLQNLDPRTWSLQFATTLREAMRLGQALPRATESLLKQVESGSLRIGLDIPDFRRQVNHLYTISNRMTAGLITAGMIIGSSIAMGVSPTQSWAFIPVLGVVGFTVSMLIGGSLVWSVFLDMWRINRRKENNHRR